MAVIGKRRGIVQIMGVPKKWKMLSWMLFQALLLICVSSAFAQRAGTVAVMNGNGLASDVIGDGIRTKAKDGLDLQEKPEDWNLHVQSTGILQGHPGFSSLYSGPNSLESHKELTDTVSSTLFVGKKLWSGAEIYCDPEITQGKGLSDTVGIAGFPNGEATRSTSVVPSFYVSRLFLRQTIALGGEQETIDSEENQLAGKQDISRLTITVGKVAAPDFFDGNSYSHDPQTQFLNWAFMENGAWDYPADARGYTNGLAIEYHQKKWAFRVGGFAVPREANGFHLNPNIWRANGDVFELENGYSFFHQPGIVRWLGYLNLANMGKYKDATTTPEVDIKLSRKFRMKYGAGINVEQRVTKYLGAFLRLGWNDGRTETWSFTEIDRTLSMGLSCKGARWSRPQDTVGLGWLINGLSIDHRNYLAVGGVGFLLGDGRIRYAPEKILETYYDLNIVKGIFLALDYQLINDPAYNADRGPVSVLSARLHWEF